MCLLDYLIMFIFPDDVTDRCLLEDKTPADVLVHTNVAIHTETMALPAVLSCHVAHNDVTSTPDKYIHCHPLTCQKLTEMDFLCS